MANAANEPEASGEDTIQLSFFGLVRSLPANFWFANLMEIFERLAFFGVRAIAPLYLVAKSGDNGLALTFTQKGTIYAWWALIQCLVPMVSGGYTERYGYRKSLVVAFLVNIVGYLGMANSKPLADYLTTQGWEGAGYWVFLVAACCVAMGTAIFKPPCHGTIAKTTDENTSSMGWGLFYWVVNIGGALAPMAAAQLRGEIDWHYVFYAAAIVTAFNFLPLFILYREPEKTPPKEGETHQNAIEVFLNSIFTILKDLRLVIFLLIFSCFWLMFMQLWDLLPNFIDEWVDTSDVAAVFGWVSSGWVLPDGQAKPEMLINIDSLAIIAFVLLISWLIRKINKVAAMILGMIIALVGFVSAGMTALGWLCCLMIFVFAIGEMMCSPTFSAYVGLIAPKDKKALYMGYSNIPFAIGWALGNLVGGYFYDHYGSIAELAHRHLATDTQLVADATPGIDWSDSLERIPGLLPIERKQAFGLAQEHLGLDATATADYLREAFRYDRGQIENLALLHLALHPKNLATSTKGYAQVANALAERIQSTSGRFVGEVDAVVGGDKQTEPSETLTPPDTTERPKLTVAGAIVEDAEEIRNHVARARALVLGKLTLADLDMAGLVRHLPTITGVARDEALDKVRELANADRPENQILQNEEVIAMLWTEHGVNDSVLNNLALEFLAQGTDLVQNAVANLQSAYPPERVEDRTHELERRVGITKDKSLAAVRIALGGNTEPLDSALAELAGEGISEDQCIYAYLASQGRHRYRAVRETAWRHNSGLLRNLIRTDDAARDAVLAEIDKVGFVERIVKAVQRLSGNAEEPGVVTEEGIDYQRLAGKPDLIQKALSAKDWRKAPVEARQLLRLNPFEARALAATGERNAEKALWNAHRPYMVWLYLGSFGLAGTIGMLLFYLITRKPQAANGE